MLESWFGAEMPLAVRFFLAFLIVLGLIGVTAWAVRRFGAGRLGGGAARGRQPRLAVVDYASVDGRRRLILVRRDNIEHLMMIGGPTDVVVEANIVRATPAARDVASARPPAGIEALPRAIAPPENGNGGWPLQPEPTGTPLPSRAAPRHEPLPDELPRPLPPSPETPSRPQRDTLAALADELSARPSGRPRPAPPRPQTEEAQPEAKAEKAEKTEARKPAAAAPTAPTPSTAMALAPPPSPVELATSPDQSLADMARRLEAALRKTPAEARAQAAPPPAAPRAAEPKLPPRPTKPEAKPALAGAPNKASLYDNLEQEMASLLGRPTKP